MNRRITKSMAHDAAKRLKIKVYGKNVEDAQKTLNLAVESLVRKYIPKPVIACVNEYYNYFSNSTSADVTSIMIDAYGTSRRKYIRGCLSFKVPSCTVVVADVAEYETVAVLKKNLDDLVKEQNNFGEEIEKALCSLRTEKSIREALPEALPYIDFPEIKSLPSPIYSDLRALLIVSEVNSK